MTPEGGRVLGCLVEKQLTTPQQYPLTLNALSAACSQSTNRDPVMTMDEGAVQLALDELKALRVVRFVLPSHGKSVIRYRHVLDEAHGLDVARLALMATLLLRGPQTPGELRVRTGRMAEFDSVGALQEDLEVLAGQPEPLVRLLPRRPGQKEDRWQQLLAAETAGQGGSNQPEQTPTPSPSAAVAPPGGPSPSLGDAGSPLPAPDPDDAGPGLERRVARLESEVAVLRALIVDLGDSLVDLRHSLGE
jgi:uncharacterized protein YceH (UPF0502 family)